MKKAILLLLILLAPFVVSSVEVPSSSNSDSEGNLVFTPSQSFQPKFYEILDEVEIEEPFILKGLNTNVFENRLDGVIINYTVIFSVNITINKSSSASIPDNFNVRVSDVDGKILNLKETKFPGKFSLQKVNRKGALKDETDLKKLWKKEKNNKNKDKYVLDFDGKKWLKGEGFIFNGTLEMLNLSSFQLHFGTNTSTTNFTVAGGNLANNVIKDVYATSSAYYIATAGELAKINRDTNVQIANNTLRGYNSVEVHGAKVYAASNKGLVIFNDDSTLSYNSNYSTTSTKKIAGNTVNTVSCKNITAHLYCVVGTTQGISLINVSGNTVFNFTKATSGKAYLTSNNSLIFENGTHILRRVNLTRITSNFTANHSFFFKNKLNDVVTANKDTSFFLGTEGGVVVFNATRFDIGDEYYNTSTLAPLILGWWHMSDGTDVSGKGLSLTLVNGANYGANSGKFGGGLDLLDGKTDYVDVNKSNIHDGMKELSISAWVKSNAANADARYYLIVGKFGGVSGVDRSYQFRYRDAGPTNSRMNPVVIDSAVVQHSSEIVSARPYLMDGKWHHAVMTIDFNKGNLTTYIDGLKDSGITTLDTTKTIINLGSARQVQIGGGISGPINWNGTIDEVRLINKSLTAEEVFQEYVGKAYQYQGPQFSILSGSTNNVTALALAPNNQTLYVGQSQSGVIGSITQINISSETQSFNWTKGDGHEQLVNYSITSLFTDTLSAKGTSKASNKVLLIGTAAGATSVDLTDRVAPIIVNASITAGLVSGENGTIRVNITDNFALIHTVVVRINRSTGQVFSYNMNREGSTDFYNRSFEAGKLDTWNFKIRANDSSSNLNNTVAATTFSVTKPSATANENRVPANVLPFSGFRISSNISATDRLRAVNATLQIPKTFTFINSSGNRENQSFNNITAGSFKRSVWYATAPFAPGNYFINISWADFYKNTYNTTSIKVRVINLSQNISSLVSNDSTTNSRLNNVQTNVTTLQSNATSTNSRLNKVQTNVTSLQTNSTNVNSRLNKVQSNVTTLQSNSSSVNTRLNRVQSNITGLQVNSTFMDISVNPRPTASGNVEVKIYTYDINGYLVNINDMNITVYDANKNKNTGPVDYDSKLATGVYQYNLTAPSTPEGLWEIEVNASRSGRMFSDRQYFLVVGGPFDVRNINIVDNTITELGTSVELYNTGNVKQDLVLNWNLTEVDNGALLDSGQNTIAVNGGQLMNYTVYPSTNYLGSVKVTFLGFYGTGFSEQAGAQKTFTTVNAVGQSPAKVGGASPAHKSRRSPPTTVQKPAVTPVPPLVVSEEEKKKNEEEKNAEVLAGEKSEIQNAAVEMPAKTQNKVTSAAITPIIPILQIQIPSISSVANSLMLFLVVLVLSIIALVRFAGLKTSFDFKIGYENEGKKSFVLNTPSRKEQFFKSDSFSNSIPQSSTLKHTVNTNNSSSIPKFKNYSLKTATPQTLNPQDLKQYFPMTYSEIEEQKENERVVTIKNEKLRSSFSKTNNEIVDKLKGMYKEF